MINRIQNIYGVTESGAKDLFVSSIAAFFKNFAYMLPAFLTMYFAKQLMEGEINSPMFYGIWIVALAIVMGVIIFVEYNKTFNATYSESANLRIEIANLLKELPLSYFNKHDISDLSQTVMKDVADIEHAISHAIPQFMGFVAFLIVVSSMMLFGHPILALTILLPIAFSFALLMLSKKMQHKGTKKYYDALRANSESFQEAIEMQQEIKSYGRVQEMQQKLFAQQDQNEKIHIESEFVQAIPISFSTSLLKFSLGLTILLGTTLYLHQQVSLLYLVGYMMAASKIVDAVSSLYANIGEIMYIDARISRIKALRNAPKQQGEPQELKSYDIEFQNVSFSYDGERKVVDGISFVAKQNEVTALVGPSGSGKTSVLRLMSRLYDNSDGKILIDGKEISHIDTDSLFEKISIVFQEVILFNNSVMENIRIGDKNATDEQVIAAAKMANCHEVIEKLSEGYQTMIGENGSKLSGGERQRISIARAFLKNAPIILLDEISASLDVENEMKIQESLNSLIKDKTVVIISHRLKSIENADKIIVMDDGKIDAMGTHEQLIEKSQPYQNMVRKARLTADFVY